MNKTVLRNIMADSALNSDAKLVVIFVGSHSKGKHPISNTDFSIVLGHVDDRKVARALKLAVRSGWITKAKGGWGSPDIYEFAQSPVPTKSVVTVGPTVPTQNAGTGDQLSLHKMQEQEPTVPTKCVGTTRTHANKGTRESSSSCSYIGGEGKHRIEPRVKEALEDPKWGGFRGSIRDYFENRVVEEKQWGYLMTVQTWFDGSTAAPKGFGKLTNAQQCLLVATAVNELLCETPTEEKLNYRSSRGMAGSPNVLRSKLEYHIRRKGMDASSTGMETSIGDPNARFKDDE